MELGYPPGTYSSPKWSKKFSDKDAEKAIKEVYEQYASKGRPGLRWRRDVDLEERLNNLEEILRSRRAPTTTRKRNENDGYKKTIPIPKEKSLEYVQNR